MDGIGIGNDGIGSVDGIGNGNPGNPGMGAVGAAASSVATPPSGFVLGGDLVGVDGAGAAVGWTGVPMGGKVGVATVDVEGGCATGGAGAGVAVVVDGLVDDSSNSPIARATATTPMAKTLIAMRSQTDNRRGLFVDAPGTGGRLAYPAGAGMPGT